MNGTDAPVTTTVSGTITKAGQPTITVTKNVTLNAHERREIAFDPVHVTNPVLWWPYQYGSPELYRLNLSAAVGGAASDSTSTDFGWQDGSGWSTEQDQVAQACLTTQMRALRAHASGFLWSYGSDEPPSAAHLTEYKNIAAALHWQNPTVDNVASYSNSGAGMKMDGPYVWEPPTLWWDTTKNGGAFGTTGEEGTESPPLESVQRFLAPADQWPLGAAWNYHAGVARSVFDNTTAFNKSIDGRYGTATSAADYAKKAELQNFDNTRAFFEA